jgi:hypothetical protein
MPHRPHFVLLALAALVAACRARPSEPASERRDSLPQATTITYDAQQFMETYARDLLAGDRAAIVARYDRTGAFLLGNGRKTFASYDSIVTRYAGAGWSPPAGFEWSDLSFEPVGTDAIVVAGRFRWIAKAGAAPIIGSYSALLRRQNGVLRIRLEDESTAP